MPAFLGTLNANEIFAALFNMIISQEVHSDNIAGTFGELADANRVDGSLYGDTKIVYDTDVLRTYAWANDAEAANLLALDRPNAPAQQAIILDVFRQIRLTTDQYLSKRAWGSSTAFSQFNNVILSWIQDTKRVYDSFTWNTYFGTAVSPVASQNIDVLISGLTSTPGTEEYQRQVAQLIAKDLADLMVDMQDATRKYNDYGYLRSYDKSRILVVWNSKWINSITYMDLPTIFHDEGLYKDIGKRMLPAKYFGRVNTSGGTTTAANTTIRSLVEKDYGSVHVFPSDLLPNSTAYLANETYTEDGDIICKVTLNGSVPFMSAFEVGTNFWNPRSLTENHYLTWGHNTLEYLLGRPFVTISAN